MARVAEEDERAFSELVRRYQGRVTNLVSRVLNDRECADDLAQEVFVRVFVHRRNYRHGAKLSTWLFTIAANLAKNEIRRRARRRNRVSLDAPPPVGSGSAAPLADPTEGSEGAFDWRPALAAAEPGPDRVARSLARARRAAAVPDRVGAAAFPWVPVTASAALAVLALTLFSPWVELRNGQQALRPGATQGPVAQPTLRPLSAASIADARTAVPGARGASLARPGAAGDPLAAVPDSLFDHSEAIGFVLDPMTLHRGRPATVRSGANVQGQQATITF